VGLHTERKTCDHMHLCSPLHADEVHRKPTEKSVRKTDLVLLSKLQNSRALNRQCLTWYGKFLFKYPQGKTIKLEEHSSSTYFRLKLLERYYYHHHQVYLVHSITFFCLSSYCVLAFFTLMIQLPVSFLLQQNLRVSEIMIKEIHFVCLRSMFVFLPFSCLVNISSWAWFCTSHILEML